MLPVRYFHVVFTLPSELRRLVRQHQRALIDILFRAAYASLAKLCADERHLGGRIGALAVLHTWTRALIYHPHVHMLVPGGALSKDGTWRHARSAGRFLVHVKVIGKVFAGKFLAMVHSEHPDIAIPTIAAGTDWVVYAKPVVQGATEVLRYLGRYVHKTAITDRAILAYDDRHVRFRYRESRTYRRKTMALPPEEFLRRFLQHVLPRGLHRVRSYGLLHSSHRTTLRRLQLLLRPAQHEPPPETKAPPLRCPHCQDGTLTLERRLRGQECLLLANLLELPPRGPPASAQTGGPLP